MIIAVTAVINLPASGGRKEFVYDCGVIGLCPPCTRATPLAGVGSLLVGGWGREPCAHAPDSKPTRQQGFCALLAGGCAPESKPTHQQGSCALLASGFTAGSVCARLPPPPTHQQGTHPCQGCCPCARWAHTNIPRVSDQPSLHSYLIL